MGEVTPLPNKQPRGEPTDDGGGGDFDRRLRELEVRMARLETKVDGIKNDINQNIARKTDVLHLKVWIVLGTLGVTGSLIVAMLYAANVVVNALNLLS